ncbi:hypothetical protein SAMN03159496_04519 [Rhizobium sp. NFR07]|nr:hypothetical protein SAMN03159496_04519 [Rhizobium sp. NFR07]
MLRVDPIQEDEWRKQRRVLVEDLQRRSSFSAKSFLTTARSSVASRSAPASTSTVGGNRGASAGDLSAQLGIKQRFLGLASGASPAVIKVVGFGSGAGANRLVSYIARDGRTAIENHRGEKLEGTEVPGAVAKEWADVMVRRASTHDLATFTLEVSGPGHTVSANQLVGDAFGDRAFAFAARRSPGALRIEGVVVLSSPSRGRLQPDRSSADAIEQRLVGAVGGDAAKIAMQFDSHGHGTRWGAAALRMLVGRFPEEVRDHQNQPVDSREAASKIVQTMWRPLLGSRTPRDTLHLVILAGKDADQTKFERATRAFLAREFNGHRYVFAIHDPERDPKPQAEGGKRPHLHAHAVIATRSDFDDRLNVWVTDLNRWRETFAQSARANDMKVETVARAESASARAYTHRQVRPVSFEGRTEHEGTSPAAQRRYAAKRSDQPMAATGKAAKAQARTARQTWEELTRPNYSDAVRRYAQRMLSRIDEAEKIHVREGADALSEATATTRSDTRSLPVPATNAVAANVPQMGSKPETQPDPQTYKASVIATETQRATSQPTPMAASGKERDYGSDEKSNRQGSKSEPSDSLGSAVLSMVAALKQARAAAQTPKLGALEINAARHDARMRLEARLTSAGKIAEGPGASAQAEARGEGRSADPVDQSVFGKRAQPQQQKQPEAEMDRKQQQGQSQQRSSTGRSRYGERDDYAR